KDHLKDLSPVMKLPYTRARRYVIESLRQLGREAAPEVPVLAQALKDREPDIRKKAATVLRDLGPEARQAFRALLDASRDEDEEVAGAAFTALSSLGKPIPAEMDSLTEAVGDKKRRIVVRRFAAKLLGELGPDAVKARAVLVRVLKTDNDTALVETAV